ncbi:molybdenum cofactor guanylyltransferase [Sporosarcina sp. Te-1]|nr:molybdenum cofactor guanylyltransferase [Sporosarcina sp. Te-1]QTD40558.1 molybdenum cofactor guanylyltransferase [Sporosarcina sp. Te-1]
MRTAGIILAGGLSSRFGSPKAFAKWRGKRFYEYSLQALSPFCDECMIVTRPELMLRFPQEMKVVTDLAGFAGQGPVAGILSGMEAMEADRYIVLPCDMPFMDRDVIGELLKKHQSDVTAVVLDGKHHPLVSVWDCSAKAELKQALVNGQRRVLEVQEKIGVRWVDGRSLTCNPAKVFENVNRPDMLERRGSHGGDSR